MRNYFILFVSFVVPIAHCFQAIKNSDQSC